MKAAVLVPLALSLNFPTMVKSRRQKKKISLSQSQLGQEPISFIPLSKISITLKICPNLSKVNADVDMKSNHYRRLKIDFCGGFDDLKKK